MEQKKKRNALDIAGFVFGIIATVVACGYFGWFTIYLISSISDAMNQGAFNGLLMIFILPIWACSSLPIIPGAIEIAKFAIGYKKRKLNIIFTIAQCAYSGLLTFFAIAMTSELWQLTVVLIISIIPLWVCVILGFVNITRKRSTNTPKQTLEDYKLCAYCGAKVSSEQNFCGICGKEIVNVNMVCANCGKELVQGNKFCVHCGKEVIQ